MITTLKLTNFRSLGQDVEIKLGRLNLLVGTNSGGKSNILRAISFLREAARIGLPGAVANQYGIASIRRHSSGQWSAEKRGGVRAGVEFIRSKKNAASLLILRDADDGCPRQLAPAVATQLRELPAPFPVAYVLFKPEYEVLFLPCLARMAGRELDGRPGLVAGATWTGGHWEAKRGLKEWLSENFARGKIYKPTMDQRALTQLVHLDTLRRADVPCFGTLERALSFLVAPGASGVYP